MDRSVHTIKKNTEALVIASKENGLEVNAYKSLLLFVLSHVLIVCTVPLPPGVNQIAVDKYININLSTWSCLEIRMHDEVTILRLIIVALKGWNISDIWEQP